MDIRQLRAFVTLAECLSYREAAERLWLTQPTLTKQIKMLEAEINLVLFLRDNHGTQLSRHGQQLYQDAKKLIGQFNAFKTLCQQLTNGKRGALSLGFISSATPVMPAIITAFQNAFPDIHLGLQDISSPVQQERILSGQLQAGFMRIPVSPPLAFRKTGSDCLTLIFHKSCRHQQEPLHQLWRRCTLFTVNAETCPGSALQINNFIAAHGIDARKMQCISDTRTLMTMVESRMGVAILPQSAVTVPHQDIICQPLHGEFARWDIGLVWNEKIADPVRDSFISQVTAMLAPA
ncbi:LysR-family transcriptional regulator [Sodalis praecaptivus]|uniref:LysR-family transcriptional regulator n=1 Tax=Sodalis praecaptivus TaxID=1239307 RepID=W0HQ61_9GAMM|nr:LysR family transcriptional regulator [Sodalis praecaptivus]AHF75924.1 LysR-family transcriptional regulator [Sodalis praecaptivus]